jgi:cobalt-zinc-cadmium efflux system outer membrane protein
LPGANAPPIRFPDDPEERQRYLRNLYPPLLPPPTLQPAAPGPEGHPMSLADLQRLGLAYSPAIKTAMAAVEATKGAVKQAGAYPNPQFFFEQDTVQTFQAGYQGAGVDQVIKTGNKLKLQESAAMMDLQNAKLALRRAQFDLAYQIRTNYFAVLVALESVRINQALYQFAAGIYRVQVATVQGKFAAAYEPLQLRPLVLQARISLIQAQNQYLASWRQLAAGLGLPDMPPSELEGRVDLPIPVFKYDDVLARINNHTDVLTALNSVRKARYNLALAKVTPLPDVDVHALVQKDYTTPPFNIVHSLSVTVPVPIWDQNKGAIRQAEGLLRQAEAGVPQARNALINTLADAFNRYETNRVTVELAYRQIQDQVVAYRGLRDRRDKVPGDVGFGDVVTAQQTLAGFIAAYVTALGLQWQAVIDVANVLQTDDLFQVAPRVDVAPVPDLDQLLPRHGLRDCVQGTPKWLHETTTAAPPACDSPPAPVAPVSQSPWQAPTSTPSVLLFANPTLTPGAPDAAALSRPPITSSGSH